MYSWILNQSGLFFSLGPDQKQAAVVEKRTSKKLQKWRIILY